MSQAPLAGAVPERLPEHVASAKKLPLHLLAQMLTRTATGAPSGVHFMRITAPHEARDTRVRACFDSPAAPALQAQLRAAALRLRAAPAAAAVEDLFLGKSTLGSGQPEPDGMAGLHRCVFRRCAFKSANFVLPNRNAMYNLQDADGRFVISGWFAVSEKPAVNAPPSAVLNGAEPVHALLLNHVFEDADESLALRTLLLAAPMDDDDDLLKEALNDHGGMPALRSERSATTVAIGFQPRTAAQLAAMAAGARAAVQRARDAQLLWALHGCFDARWAGGVLFLFHDAAPLCDAPLRESLTAFAATLLCARDGEEATLEALPPSPGPLPPLPVPECAACRMALSGQRRFVCSRCQAVCYHSQECQRAHWSAHKPDCKPPNARPIVHCMPMPLP